MEGENGAPHWLFFILPDRVFVYKVMATGVVRVDPNPGAGTPFEQQCVPLLASGTVVQNKRYIRDADAIRSDDPSRSDDPLVLAIADAAPLIVYPDPAELYDVLVLRFDPYTGVYLGQESQGFTMQLDVCPDGPAPGVVGGTRGCALRADGHGLFLTGETTTDCQTWTPFVRHIELGTGVATDLGYAFSGGIDPQWTRTRIYRNRTPDNSGWAIYFPAVNAVAALTGLSNLNAVSFSPAVLTNVAPPQFAPIPGGFGNNEFHPRFLNIGVAGDRYLSAENRGTCCGFLQTHGSGMVYGHRQTPGMTPTSWNATSNPYGNTSPLTCVCDLVVEEGAQLYLNNMELRFAPDAKIIVERGGRLHKHNTWTTSLTCPGDRWPGIRVEGTTSNGDQTGSAQGHLRINGGGVRNAVVGAWTAREIGNTGNVDVAYFGGMIRATSNAVFQDCITGVRIERYQRTSGTGAILPNLSLFSSCTFRTTADWPGGSPLYHAHLFDVQGIRFTQCKFRNDDPGQFPMLGRGYGILGLLAGFDVEGSTTPEASLFQDLTIGVAAATGTLRKANIRRTWFQDNHIGAYLQACNAPEVSRSHFNVPALAITPFSPMGLVLHHSTGYLVEENNFHGGDGATGTSASTGWVTCSRRTASTTMPSTT